MLRYGFYNDNSMQLEEISNKYGISRERVRQIESKGLMKIRRSIHVKKLAEYMQNPDQALQNIEFYGEKYKIVGNCNKKLLKEDLTKKKNKF